MSVAPSLSVLDHISVWAINVGLQATILTATALLCAAMLRRVPVTRYWVLCCSLVLLLCSPILATRLQYTGSGWIVFSAQNYNALSSNTVPQSRTINVPNRFAQASLDVKQPIDVATKTHDLSDEVSSITIAANTPSQEFDSGSNTSVTSRQAIQWIPSWLRIAAALSLVVWGIGAGVLLTRMLVGWVRMSRILRQAQPVANQELIRLFEQACIDAGINRNRMPRLTISDAVSGPIAAGLRLGTVVLPSRLASQLSACELSSIFVHEVAHIVRCDQILVLLQNFVSAIFWPHPLVSKLNRELAKASEEVCDNFVLATLPATAYSRTLLSLAETFRRPQQLPGSVGFFSSHWKLEQRVAGLLDDRRGRRTMLRKRDQAFVFGIAMSLAALMCVATISISGAQSQDEGTAQSSGKTATEAASDSLLFKGRVVDSDGKPISGARIRFIPLGDAFDRPIDENDVSDANGAFAIRVKKQSDQDGFDARLSEAGIMVETEGYNLRILPAADFDPTGELIKLNKSYFRQAFLVKSPGPGGSITLERATSPIKGKIIDTEGRGVAKVRVSLVNVYESRDGSLENWTKQATEKKEDLIQLLNQLQHWLPRYSGYDSSRQSSMVVSTDDNGQFSLPSFGEACVIELLVQGPGIETSRIYVRSESGETIAFEYQSVPSSPVQRAIILPREFTYAAGATQRVVGHVVDADSGKPIKDIAVRAFRTEREVAGGSIAAGAVNSISDAQGRFELEGLPIGRSELQFQPPKNSNYLIGGMEVNLRATETNDDLKVALKQGVQLTGKAIDSSGAPVTGTVEYFLLLGDPILDRVPTLTKSNQDYVYDTDKNGVFAIPVLPGKGILTFKAFSGGLKTGVGADKIPYPRRENSGRPFATNLHSLLPWMYDFLAAVEFDEGTVPEPLEIRLERAK